MRLQSSFIPLLSSVCLALFVFSNPVSAGDLSPWPPGPKANLSQCKEDIRNHILDYEPFLVAPDGSRTFNVNEAIGTDYATCKEYCGTSPSSFQWNVFSPQFTGWLLPFLALTAQLPYQSDGVWHNLMSLFLTVGSRQLAMYSLALTILSSRYAKQRLDHAFSQYPEPATLEHLLVLRNLKKEVFQTLRVSQQQPFELGDLRPYPPDLSDFTKTKAELLWWTTVQKTLARSRRFFTASLATQAAWVIIAFSFTWVDAFGSEKIGTNGTAFGLAIALCWSWVLVLVLGWFFAGVSLSREHMTEAIKLANLSYPESMKRLAVYEHPQGFAHMSLTRRIPGDAERTGPVYNYAKVFVWSHTVDHVIDTIQQNILNLAPIAVRIHPPTSDTGDTMELRPLRSHIPTPSMPHIMEIQPIHSLSSSQTSRKQHLQPPSTPLGSQSLLSVPRRYSWTDNTTAYWKGAVYSRVLWASIISMLLNVATVGSAFWLCFLTPSVGLGCRSGGVLIYWMTLYII
ncbi:hypothetical protein CPB86DRAFT_877490 [Serendipita vermifera]|nr:hypothetical protein CPB86DRAFT_877490 [Serendipita vermifera]